MRNVSDRAFVADEIIGASIIEMFVEYTVETLDFVLVACGSVFDVIRGVADEVVGLTLPG